MLTTLFNACIHPLAAFLYNVGVVVKLVLTPVAEIIGLVVVNPLSQLLRSLRLVEMRGAHDERGAAVA